MLSPETMSGYQWIRWYKFRHADARILIICPMDLYKFNTDIGLYYLYVAIPSREAAYFIHNFKSDEMGIVINYESASFGSGKK